MEKRTREYILFLISAGREKKGNGSEGIEVENSSCSAVVDVRVSLMLRFFNW